MNLAEQRLRAEFAALRTIKDLVAFAAVLGSCYFNPATLKWHNGRLNKEDLIVRDAEGNAVFTQSTRCDWGDARGEPHPRRYHVTVASLDTVGTDAATDEIDTFEAPRLDFTSADPDYPSRMTSLNAAAKVRDGRCAHARCLAPHSGRDHFWTCGNHAGVTA